MISVETGTLQGGFFGAMGERGVGGSKCGATCALALVIEVRAADDHILFH